MSAAPLAVYRRALFGAKDDLFDRCLSVAAVVGAVWAVVALLMPVRKAEVMTVAQMPKRFARLIVEPPKPAKTDRVAEAPRPAGEAPVAEAPASESAPAAPVTPAPQVRRPGRDLPAPIDPNAGQAGRARAQATVAAELAGTSQALSSALDGLSSSLASGSGGSAPAGGRDRGPRGVRAARAVGALGAGAGGGLAGGGGSADLGGSAIQGSRVAVGSLSGYGGGGGGGAGGSAGGAGGDGQAGGDAPGGSGAAPGVYRSNASLLSVIQKYAAGIHYCYTNELKHDPALRGKIVFALTVAANGDVTEATVVENSLRSPRLTSCALAQVREWKFPPVARGVTTFQAPFVFTPPE